MKCAIIGYKEACKNYRCAVLMGSENNVESCAVRDQTISYETQTISYKKDIIEGARLRQAQSPATLNYKTQERGENEKKLVCVYTGREG